MFEVIPLKFVEKEKDVFEGESIFGNFRIWKITNKENKVQTDL